MELLGQAAQQQREAMEAVAPDWLRIARGPFHKSTPVFPQTSTPSR
jgi:hypothetical protein